MSESASTILCVTITLLLFVASTFGSQWIAVSAASTGKFDDTWYIDNCPEGTETIVNGVLQTRESTPGGNDNNYGYCTAQRGTFPWGSTVGTPLPSGIVTVSTTANFLNRVLLSGSRYHIYVAFYYRLDVPVTVSSTTYEWIDTQVRIENIDGVDSPVGTTERYDPGDSFGWDIVVAELEPGQSYTFSTNIEGQFQSALNGWGIPGIIGHSLEGIEIGTEGFHIEELDVDWPSVSLGDETPPVPDFGLSLSSSSLTIQIGYSAVSTVTVSSINGFTGNVFLTATADPELDVLLSRTSVILAAGGSQTLTMTITVLASTNLGSYTASVHGASDSLQHSADVAVEATSQPANNPPTLNVPASVSGTAGTILEFVVSASDPDPGQLIVLVADALPSGASFDTTTGQFSWIPTTNEVGTHIVSFSATDNGSPPESDEKSVQIQVQAAGSPPPSQPPDGQGPCPLCQVVSVVESNLILLVGIIAGAISAGLTVWFLRARGRIDEAR